MSEDIRILVVEDDSNIRQFVASALESEGYHVAAAGSLRQAGVELGARSPDLIVLDLGLPDGDGVQFIRDFRGWSAVPILVLSARSLETDKVAALDAGADDYLSKPFGVSELLARVRAQLRRRTPPVTPSRSSTMSKQWQVGQMDAQAPHPWQRSASVSRYS